MTLFCKIFSTILGTRYNSVHITYLICDRCLFYGIMYAWNGNMSEILIFKLLASVDSILHHIGHQVHLWYPHTSTHVKLY